jgi:hypothetical protein
VDRAGKIWTRPAAEQAFIAPVRPGLPRCAGDAYQAPAGPARELRGACNSEASGILTNVRSAPRRTFLRGRSGDVSGRSSRGVRRGRNGGAAIAPRPEGGAKTDGGGWACPGCAGSGCAPRRRRYHCRQRGRAPGASHLAARPRRLARRRGHGPPGAHPSRNRFRSRDLSPDAPPFGRSARDAAGPHTCAARPVVETRPVASGDGG